MPRDGETRAAHSSRGVERDGKKKDGTAIRFIRQESEISSSHGRLKKDACSCSDSLVQRTMISSVNQRMYGKNQIGRKYVETAIDVC